MLIDVENKIYYWMGNTFIESSSNCCISSYEIRRRILEYFGYRVSLDSINKLFSKHGYNHRREDGNNWYWNIRYRKQK